MKALLLSMLMLPVAIVAQNMPVKFHSIQLTLNLGTPDSTIQGEVSYRISAQQAGVESLWLLARRTDVRTVRLNEEELEFSVKNDTLLIPLSGPLTAGTRHKLDVLYIASPNYGVHWWPKDHTWTSLRDGALASWVPVIPDSTILVTTDIQFIVPSGHQAISIGEPVEGSTLSHWRSTVPVPITSLMFASGPFLSVSSNVYTAKGIDPSIVSEDVLADTTSRVIVLPDHRWEMVTSSGAGLDYEFLNTPINPEEERPDILRLGMDVITDGESGLVIKVTRLSGRARGNITLPIVQFINGTRIPAPLTVASTGDVTRISAHGRLDNLMIEELPDSIRVIETKPGRFWLHQMRSSTDKDARLAAASALGTVTDMPDIGLALSDFYRQETDPAMKSALLVSYATQSKGRVGSHPLLISALKETSEVRLVAMRSLSGYVDSEPVKSAVLNIIRNSNDIPLVNEALKTYRNLFPAAQADDLMRRLLNEDHNGDFALTILNAFKGRTEAERIRGRAPYYLNPRFPYVVRKSAFVILTETEKVSSSWSGIFARYAQDADPRFRNDLVDASGFLNPEDRQAWLQDRLFNEYDDRILERLRALD